MASWVALPGNLFIRLVQMIMVPLIVSSIVLGIAGGESKGQLRTTGLGLGLYFVATMALAVVVGVVLTFLVKPGLSVDTGALGLTRAAVDPDLEALLVVTTVAASIGTPSTPGAGVIILATILTSMGIPVAGVALIIGVDSLLGMCRTAVNVMGDLTAAMLFDRRATPSRRPETSAQALVARPLAPDEQPREEASNPSVDISE